MNEMQAEELKLIVRDNIIARRKEMGLSQSQLADKVKVAQPYISALEKGDRTPTLATLAKLAESLATTPDALLTRDIFSPAGV